MLTRRFAYALLLIPFAAGIADAQWFPYPGPVIGYPIPPYLQGHNAASIRTQVIPRETQVFVDGYSAGLADDFDGVFQRLQLVPGQHQITFYLSGYRTYREDLYLSPGASRTIRHTMVQHAAGEADDAAPIPFAPPMWGPGGPPPAPTAQTSPNGARYGTLMLRVQPADASVIIDGEEWHGAQPEDRLTVQLGAGRHHVQVEKSGFQTFSGDVEITADQTSALNISLLAQ